MTNGIILASILGPLQTVYMTGNTKNGVVVVFTIGMLLHHLVEGQNIFSLSFM